MEHGHGEGPSVDFIPEKLTKNQGMTLLLSKALESKPWQRLEEKPDFEERRASVDLDGGTATLSQKRRLGDIDIASSVELHDWTRRGAVDFNPGVTEFALNWTLEGRSLSTDPAFMAVASVFLEAIQDAGIQIMGADSEENL
ncbi:MAG TPA: hypothetical protein VFP35_00585 [Candidatus Saccharimonadales bacterium]|nr:hypothetical protein [Candidatus Saccharimonadales bacterium]